MLFAKEMKKICQIWPRETLKHFTAAYRGFPPCTQSQQRDRVQQCTTTDAWIALEDEEDEEEEGGDDDAMRALFEEEQDEEETEVESDGEDLDAIF